MLSKEPKSWLIRVILKAFWLLGFLPLVLDFLFAYIPQEWIPERIRLFIENGASWSITLILITIGLLVSAFLVNKEDQKIIRQLKTSREDSSLLMPSVIVKLCLIPMEPTNELSISISENPTKPDIDMLINNKRNELLGKEKTPQATDTLAEAFRTISQSALMASLSEPNPNYKEDIEKYLLEYESYLVKEYEIKLDRAFKLAPYFINEGKTSATSASIEFIMPDDYYPPLDHQKKARSFIDAFDIEYHVHPPEEPKRYKNIIGEISSVSLSTPWVNKSIQEELNSEGPFFHKSNGKWIITYNIGELVPQKPLFDFDPFWIWAGTVSIDEKWTIKTKVYANELSSPQESQIQVHFIADD